MEIQKILARTSFELAKLTFSGVHTVYNPLEYAIKPHLEYWRRYGGAPKEAVFLGMNPGPYGMAQTGVPFGEITVVRDWLKIQGEVKKPANEHPKRPITGFSVTRSEVSGKRLWGLMQKTFATPEAFFADFFIANYCPLMFLGPNGENITPDKFPARERERLKEVLDECLRDSLSLLKPKAVVGIGKYAADSAGSALAGTLIKVVRATHPSPANPKANKGWENIFLAELREAGIELVNFIHV